jgi:hypothetical protein
MYAEHKPSTASSNPKRSRVVTRFEKSRSKAL